MKYFLFSLLVVLTLPSLAQELSDDLLVHYPFNGDFLDASGNEFHGVGTSVDFSEDHTGTMNSAANFNGIDAFISLPNLEELKPELPVSIAFWIKYDSDQATQRALFNTSYEEDVNSGVHFTTQSATGKYAVGFGDGENGYGSDSRRTFLSEAAVETGEWHHIAIVVTSANNMKIYVDCEDPGGSYSGTGGDLAYASLPGTIGKHDQHTSFDGYFFKGQLSDFWYWNREVSLDEFNLLCDPTGGNGIASIEDRLKGVYPNPTNGHFSLEVTGDLPSAVIIQNLMGEVLFNLPYQKLIAIDEIESGFYLVRLISNLGEVVGMERIAIIN